MELGEAQARRLEQAQEKVVEALHVRRHRAERSILRSDRLATGAPAPTKKDLVDMAARRRAEAMVSASTFAEDVSRWTISLHQAAQNRSSRHATSSSGIKSAGAWNRTKVRLKPRSSNRVSQAIVLKQ